MVLQHELCVLGEIQVVENVAGMEFKGCSRASSWSSLGGSLPSSEDFVFSLTLHKILHSSSVRGAGSRALECQG